MGNGPGDDDEGDHGEVSDGEASGDGCDDVGHGALSCGSGCDGAWEQVGQRSKRSPWRQVPSSLMPGYAASIAAMAAA
jgi:hypothetical protein